MPVKPWKDTFGNFVLSGLDTSEHTSFSLDVSGIVRHTPYRICDTHHGMYSVASPLTVCTPVMLTLLQKLLATHKQDSCALNNTIDLLHGEEPNQVYTWHMNSMSEHTFKLACTIASAVHSHLRYIPKSTEAHTLAGEAFSLGSGVCQDYAHITIALCRKAGIPARYACGFIMGEGESHAWVEVFIRGGWYGIDPTHHRRIHTGYITVAHGRDSADCPMNRGTFSGSCTQKTSICVKMVSL